MTNGGGGGGDRGGNGGSNKPEPLQPHPVMEQLPDVQYCINSPPPWLEAVLLGFQHSVLSLASIVLIPSMLVPQMGGGNNEKAMVIQNLLLASGLSTLMQSIFGTRLPTVTTGSYAFLVPTISIIQARQYKAIEAPYQRFSDTMRSVQFIIAGAFQLFLGVLGIWRNLAKFLSPLSLVPLVSFTGLGLSCLSFPMFNDTIAVVCLSHATVAGLVALIMDCTLPRGNDPSLKDSGKHWWEKFIDYHKDVRSDEFYKLPCRLNKFWPPL